MTVTARGPAGSDGAWLGRACVHELVAWQATERPDAPAVSCAGTVLSYRELDHRAERLADHLVHQGVRRGDVVAVLTERSVQLVVALLAVLKSGAAYLAVDPDLPGAQIGALLLDARVRLALSGEAGAERMPDTVTPVEIGGRPPHEVPPRAPIPAHPEQLAYVSYTSGSTGAAKGVAVPHGAVSRLVVGNGWARFSADDVFLQLAPVAFDASTLEIWAPLVRGARLAVYPPNPVLVDELARVLDAERVTVCWMTAGLFHRMVDLRLDDLGGLRHLLAGGDVVSATHVTRLLQRYPGMLFTNGYGPTENTTFTTCWTSRTAPAAPAVPIGRPIDETTVAILDADLDPVPTGVVGELYTAGRGLARGYLHRPGATAERFLPDPRSPHPGGRMYRTGDLARWLPSGDIEFIGRADDQVKIRGYRVEPGAVQAAVAGCPGVRDSAVVVGRAPNGDPRLLAYVVPEGPDDHGELVDTVLSRLRAELPPYAVPWVVATLPELPLTRNGKVDRAALPPAERAPRTLPTEYVPPRDQLEAELAQSWGALLGVEPIGVDDDFFELGGHSLIAAELLGVLQQEFAVALSARTLYLSPTVGELAGVLGAAIASRNREGNDQA
jgi:amino acid adenylation domain-containing protein